MTDQEQNELVIRYQRGEVGLEAVYRSLEPLVWLALRRYRGRSLPPSIDFGDLVAESWLMIDRLARRWDPHRGDIGAYVGRSISGELGNYVRRESPARRTKRIRIVGADSPNVYRAMLAVAGDDGRRWDELLEAVDLLRPLNVSERRVVWLNAVDERSFTDIAPRLQLTRSATYRLYRRAVRVMNRSDDRRRSA